MPTSRDIQADSRAFDERYGEVRLLRRRQFVGAVSRVTGVPGELLDRVYEDAESEYARAPVEGMAKHAYARACVRSRAMEHLESIGGFGRLLLKHKYIRRIPTGNPKRPWRYIYPEDVKPRAKVEGLDLGFVQESQDKAQLELGLGMPRLPEQHFLDTSPPTVGPVRYDMPLSKVEEVIRREPLEHLVVFDHLTGQQVFRARGSGESVDFGRAKHREWRQHGECVATHNHPCGTVFSDSDLFAAIGADLQEIRAVAPNGGTFVFTRPAQGWGTADGITGDEVRELVDDARDRGMARATSRMDQIIKQAGGKPNEGSRAEGYDQRTWLRLFSEETERAYNEVFRARGLEWQVEHQGTRYLAPVIDDGDGQGMAPALPPRPVHYASGSNRTPDIRGLAYDLGLNVGLVVDEIRDEQFNLLHGLAGKGVKVFVDSGAFGEVRFRKDGPPEVVKPISDSDWRAKLDTYKDLARVLGSQLTLVAPDQVGNQAVTLERMRRYREDMYDAVQYGARVLVPVQKGDAPMAEFYRSQAEALGYGIGIGDRPEYEGAGYYVPAIPMMKDATSPEQVGEFVAAVQPPEVHLLGMGPSSQKLEKTLDAIRDASPGTVITMDSNLLGSKQGRDRKKTLDNPTGARDFTRVQDEIERRMNMLMGPQVSDDVLRDSVESGNRYAAMSNAMGAPQLAFTRPQLRAIARKAGLKPRSEGGKGLFEKWVESPELWDSPQFRHFSGRTHEQYRAVLRALEDAAYTKYVWPYRSDPGRARQVKKQAAIRQVFGGGGDAAKSFRGIVMGLMKAQRATPPPGYQPVPGSRVGGYKKRVGGKWDYWYPPGTKAEQLTLQEILAGAGEHLQTDAEREEQFNIFDDLWKKAEDPKTVVESTRAGEVRTYAQHVEYDPARPWTDPDWTPDLESYDYILINSSAGKDSQAMLTRMVELADERGYPRDRLIVVHADLGRVEWDDTKELAEQQAKHYGLRFETVAREEDLLDQVQTRFNTLTANANALAEVIKGSGLVEPTWEQLLELGQERVMSMATDSAAAKRLWKIIGKKGEPTKKQPNRHRKIAELSRIPWPSSQARYCTSDHKTSQVKKFVTRLHEEHGRDKSMRVLNTLGIRAQESSERAKKLGFRPKKDYETKGSKSKGKRTCDEWYPIFGWPEEQVWDTIRDSGVEHHRAYDLGMSRLSCAFCVFAPQHALVTAAKHNPRLFEQYLEVERKVGADFQHGKPLSDIARVLAKAQEREVPPELVQLGCTRVGQGLKKSWAESSISDFIRVMTAARVALEAAGQPCIALDYDWKEGGACVHLNTGDKSHHIAFLDGNKAYFGSLVALSIADTLGLRFVEHGAPPPADAGSVEVAGLSGVLRKARAVKYIKRVPTGNPRRPWRYIYPGDENKGSSSTDDQLALFDWKPKLRRKSPRDRLEQYREELSAVPEEAIRLIERDLNTAILAEHAQLHGSGPRPLIPRLPPMESLTDLIRAQITAMRGREIAKEEQRDLADSAPVWSGPRDAGQLYGLPKITGDAFYEIWGQLSHWATGHFEDAGTRSSRTFSEQNELETSRYKQLAQFSSDPPAFIEQAITTLYGEEALDPDYQPPREFQNAWRKLARAVGTLRSRTAPGKAGSETVRQNLPAIIAHGLKRFSGFAEDARVSFEVARLSGGYRRSTEQYSAPMHPKLVKFLSDVGKLEKDDPAFAVHATELNARGVTGLVWNALDRVVSDLYSPKKELGHWGSANSTNHVAWTTAAYGDSGRFRPLDKGMELIEETVPESYRADGAARDWWREKQREAKARYVYAQDQLDKFPRSEHPRMYRGMGLPKGVAESLKEGETIPMTGCTAFTFYDHVARRYMDSEWTQGKSEKDAVPTLITLERTQDFDDSIAGWHHAHSSKDDPAFEIVSGVNALRIKSIKRESDRILITAEGVLEGMETTSKGSLSTSFSELLHKARAVKYIKRVPTGNPKRPWRYIYPGDEATGSSSTDDQLDLFDWQPKPRRKSPRDRLEQYRKDVYEPEITDELVHAVELAYRKEIESRLEWHEGQSPLPPMESLTDLIRAQMEAEREYQVASNALFAHRRTRPSWPVRVKGSSSERGARENVVNAWAAIAEALEDWTLCIHDRESLKKQGVEGAALRELQRQRRKELNQFSKDPDTFLRQSMEVLFGDPEPDPSTSKFLGDDIEIHVLAADTVNGFYKLRWYRMTNSNTDAYLAAMVPWYLTERQKVDATKGTNYKRKRLFGGDPSEGSRSKRFQVPMHPKKAKFLRDVRDLAKDDPAFSLQAKELGKYGIKGAPVTRTIEKLLYAPEPKLGHWGSAVSTNEVAWTTAVYGDSGRMRPLDGGMKLWEIPESYKHDHIRKTGKARYVYAQDQLDKFPRSEHPRMYRGMGLPAEVAENLKEGETIPMTGCTAFTFYKSVAKRYSSSDWTRGKSEKDAVPTLITIERTQDFDDSVAGWHHSDQDRSAPAFEIVSGINALRVKSIKRKSGRILITAEGVLE